MLVILYSLVVVYSFFNDPPTTEIYTLSLHDALPISWCSRPPRRPRTPRSWWSTPRSPRCSCRSACARRSRTCSTAGAPARSEEHTSELQSQFHLVCRLLLEKKKQAN